MMNSTNKLSVIIPLYNAGDDFRTCMESLITQTWTALEIIIINERADSFLLKTLLLQKN